MTSLIKMILENGGEWREKHFVGDGMSNKHIKRNTVPLSDPNCLRTLKVNIEWCWNAN